MPTRVVVIQTDTPEETQAVARAVQTLMGPGSAQTIIGPVPPPALPAAPEEDDKTEDDGGPASESTPEIEHVAIGVGPHVIGARPDRDHPRCPECGKPFVDEERLAVHRENRHGVRREGLRCPECGNGPFKTAAGLKQHRTIMHSGEGAGKSEYRCVECNWSGKSQKALDAHKGLMHSRKSPTPDGQQA